MFRSVNVSNSVLKFVYITPDNIYAIANFLAFKCKVLSFSMNKSHFLLNSENETENSFFPATPKWISRQKKINHQKKIISLLWIEFQSACWSAPLTNSKYLLIFHRCNLARVFPWYYSKRHFVKYSQVRFEFDLWSLQIALAFCVCQ